MAPAVCGLLSAPKWTGLSTSRLPQPDPALRHPGPAETCSTDLLVFGARSLNHSHSEQSDYHILQKCDKAQQLRALAPPPLGFSPPLSASPQCLSCVAPPTFNPFRDVIMDLPLCTQAHAWGNEGGARRPHSNWAAGALNRNVFEDMIKLYKLSN